MQASQGSTKAGQHLDTGTLPQQGSIVWLLSRMSGCKEIVLGASKI